MNKKTIIISIMIVCVISLVANFIFLLPYIKKDEKTLKNNKIDRDKTYAIMVQNEDKSGYIESTSNTFPSDMTLNEELTNCVDENGTKADNPFTYENGIITVRTSKKIYCYLYFDAKSGISSGSDLILNPTTGLNTTLEGGLYRYQGTSVDNYICFGTSDKPTCLNNLDAHMYRIIGIAEDGKIKLLKNEALNSAMPWHSNNTSNIPWPQSTIYTNINGSSFYTNTTYVPTAWQNKIAITSWKYGSLTDDNMSADALYNTENAWTETVDAKIGLMYVSDYYYSQQVGGKNCAYDQGLDVASICKTAWMHISNCDSAAPSTYEKTMSHHKFSTYAYAWSIYPTGYVYGHGVRDEQSVRPVFFLKSDINLIGGTGKSDDPFIIS